MRILAFLLIAGALARAQSIENVRPACGAAGDHVLISGSGFAEEPAVTIDGIEADVLGAKEGRILVEVPEGAAGEARIDVDGATWDDFTAVDEDAPVVLHMSADTATAGQVVILIGRRLHGAEVEFVDGDGVVQATSDLAGGHRAIGLKVPDTLAAGTYTLLITNGDGVDSGDCSPEIEIVQAGDAAIEAVEPEGQLPGQHLKLTGTNLGPFGPVFLKWTDSGDNELKSFGFSNGFDRIWTRVPFQATAGETYDIVAEFRDKRTATAAYTVGTPGEPFIGEIDPAEGPAGSLFALRGANLLVLGSKTRVEMKNGADTIEAKVFLGHPGFGGKSGGLLVMVPKDAAERVYDVTVTVGGRTSNAEKFEVVEPELTVTKMAPDSQGTGGTMQRVHIEGTGFGQLHTRTPIAVIWEKDGEEREGHLLFRTDRLLVLIPPGGKWNPLEAGEYTVTVVLDPEGDAESAEAGQYTVE